MRNYLITALFVTSISALGTSGAMAVQKCYSALGVSRDLPLPSPIYMAHSDKEKVRKFAIGNWQKRIRKYSGVSGKWGQAKSKRITYKRKPRFIRAYAHGTFCMEVTGSGLVSRPKKVIKPRCAPNDLRCIAKNMKRIPHNMPKPGLGPKRHVR